MSMTNKQVLRVGIGGPVGSGKTALVNVLCKQMRDKYQIAVVTNDIYTREDAQFLIRNEALEEDFKPILKGQEKKQEDVIKQI